MNRDNEKGFVLVTGMVLLTIFLSVGILSLETERASRDTRAFKLMADSASHAGVTCLTPGIFPTGDEKYAENWVKARLGIMLALQLNNHDGIFVNASNIVTPQSKHDIIPGALCDPSPTVNPGPHDCYNTLRFNNYDVTIRRGIFYYNSAKTPTFEPLDFIGEGNLPQTVTEVTCPNDAGTVCPAGSTMLKWEVANAVQVTVASKGRTMSKFFGFIGVPAETDFTRTSTASVAL